MIIIGLTGGIAMGKSTVAAQLRALGVPVLDSDKVVHGLLERDLLTIEKIRAVFPAAYKNKKIDRAALGKEVFGKPTLLQELESILHPEVHREQQRFIRRERMKGKRMVALDIPLLFETGAETRCDYTMVATAPDFVQLQRALKRVGMNEEKLKHIRARQLSDHEKRKRADFIVLTGLGKKESLKAVRQILRTITRHSLNRLRF